LLFYKEADALYALGLSPSVYAHPDCLVTTFADMIINQELENRRGNARHGSVGVGVNETIERSQIPELKITMSDLWNGISTLPSKLEQICGRYAEFRIGRKIDEPRMMEAFIKGCWAFAEQIHPAGMGQCKDPVFEGAQGLLLDQNNKKYFPHVTRSNTGIQNVRFLCSQAGIDKIEAYYVSRTYLTRHGAGPLPGEDKTLHFSDDTNKDHQYQGQLRFAPLDDGLMARCKDDYGNKEFNLVFSHCDQLVPGIEADFYAYGPSHDSIREMKADTQILKKLSA
jgi:adenylosuccinate synthase